ncbi:nucleoside hydrolase [Kitasatospora sp. NPDC004669]|uniref:nucleoside hydrolase n=1 Tax=Kitasatospora sp. NPDC004669 TaxID=3154555 RepID=UPI0033BC0976
MGDNSEDTWDDLRRHWEAIMALGKADPGGVFGMMADDMRSASWPEDLRNAPLIIDTDIGGDADDALAVAAAARCTSDLKLVITGDESKGRRARFARHLLDLMGRSDVVTVAGAELSDTPYFVVEHLIPQDVPAQSADIVAAVREVLTSTDGPVRWVGMAPLSNLAHVLAAAPEAASRLRVTQMGGALRYRNPERAEHNVRLDVPAARDVLAAVAVGHLTTPEFIASEVTFTPRIEVTQQSPLYSWLASSDAPRWAGLLAAHLDAWFSRFHPGSMQHDALTLSAALNLPFVDSDDIGIAMDDIGRTTASDDGVRLRWSFEADYDAFMAWLTRTLTGQPTSAAARPESERS